MSELRKTTIFVINIAKIKRTAKNTYFEHIFNYMEVAMHPLECLSFQASSIDTMLSL